MERSYTMRDYIAEIPPHEMNYLLSFETVLYLFDQFDYQTERLAQDSGMPKHEMWEFRKAASNEIRKLITQYVREQVYR
jgi:hypothetical protein